jgi:TolB-like protein
MPFENMTPNEVFPFTSEVVTFIITTDLSEIKEFAVSDRRSVLEIGTEKRSVAEIAKKLKVFFIVTGELVNNKDQILVNVNLSKVGKKKVTTIWGNKYYFNLKGDISELKEIALEIAGKLRMALPPEEKVRIKNY